MNAQSTLSLRRRRVGWVVSALTGAMLLLDGVMKVLKPAVVVQATIQLGYPEADIAPIGITLLVCTVAYLIPRTAPFGTILLTGYLGGAVASHIRVGSGLFETLFPILIATPLWIGFVLRDMRFRELFKTNASDR